MPTVQSLLPCIESLPIALVDLPRKGVLEISLGVEDRTFGGEGCEDFCGVDHALMACCVRKPGSASNTVPRCCPCRRM